FLHNLSDALASVGVIIAGFSILLYQWYWVDAVMTLLIAGYVLYQGFTLLPVTIHILMQGTPAHVCIDDLVKSIMALERIETVHHVHVWQLDEHQNAMEAHVVVKECDLQHIELIKQQVKEMLLDKYQIGHSTIEIEIPEGFCQQ
ncbi:MAG TPA: cation diffusion facilitator family transporter, partial [Gammaproteobacteria bacterium]|nr:cation diffusion facilitator family transporter [Gammaproteobacteria bacterium]